MLFTMLELRDSLIVATCRRIVDWAASTMVSGASVTLRVNGDNNVYRSIVVI